MISEFIINITDLVEALKEQVEDCIKTHRYVGDDFNTDVVVACWLAVALAGEDIHVEFSRPTMSWEAYSCIMNIKNDYASRLVREMIAPPIIEVLPSGTSLIAQMRVDGRDLYLKF